jgi:hypothetical protein
MLMGSYLQQRNQHHYETKALQPTQPSTSDGTHHHTQYQWRSNATCKGHWQYMPSPEQYFDDPALVDESDVQVMPMRTYELLRGLPCFHTYNPDID